MRERKVPTVVSRFPAVLPDECYHFVIGTTGREFSFSRKIMSLDLDMLALGHFARPTGETEWLLDVGLQLRKT